MTLSLSLKKKSFSKACCMLMLYFNTENLLGPVCTATQLISGLFAWRKVFMSCSKCVSVCNEDQPFLESLTGTADLRINV